MAWTVENYEKIDLTVLKKFGYLLPEPTVNRMLFRNQLGNLVGYTEIYFRANHPAVGQGSMLLTGHIKGHAFKRIINLELVASNLGRGGGQWYFRCPVSGRRCRTLYFTGKQFVSRQELDDKYYESQMDPRLVNATCKRILILREFEKMRDEWLLNPRTKKYYQDKPTRKMKRFMRLREMATQSSNELAQEFGMNRTYPQW